MDIHKKAYTVIKTINNDEVVKIKNNVEELLHNGIIIAEVVSLFQIINIDNAKLVVSSYKTSNFIQKSLLGESFEFKDFNPKLVNKEVALYKRVFIFKIQGYDYIDKRHITFGYFFLKRKRRFSVAEINVIRFVSDSIGEYLLKRTILTHESNYLKNQMFINKYESIDKKPGTLILKYLHYLCKGSNSTFAYFCIQNENKLILDYAVTNKGEKSKINIQNVSIDITTSPIKNIAEFEFIKHSNQLTNFLSKISVGLNSEFSYFICPIKNDLDTIGFWILAFSNFDYTNINKINDLISLINKKCTSVFNYLFQRKINKMIINPFFKSRNTLEQEKIFVLMPFTLEWSDRIWNKILKPTIESIGLTVKRADDLYGQDIVEDIWSEILTSKIIIADITNRNPNVFYELGIAHTLGKNVILLTQNVEDIPFDLNRYRHIIYKDNFDGYEILRNQLLSTIRNIIEVN